ncbi:MAG: porin [Burkholderiales bacterium]|nr:porin [Burkholderiales bacterium]
MKKRKGFSGRSLSSIAGPSFKARVMCTAIAGLVAMPMAHADELSKLQAEINNLSAQLNQLKQAQAQQSHWQAQRPQAGAVQTAQGAPAPALPDSVPPTKAEALGMADPGYVMRGAMPGSFKLPGTDTSMRIGGFVNFQGIYDPTQNLGPKFAIGNLLPSGPARAQSGRTFHFQDKVSRLIVQTSTPSPYGDINTNISLDFYGYTAGGDNNQALQNNNWGARIVYAYGTIGHWLFGQANSNFIDDPDQEETFDNAGPAGVPGAHTPQIRYTLPLHAGGALSFSIENPQTGYQDTQGNIEVATQTNPLPDFTAKYERSGNWGHYQVSAVARELGFTDQNGVRTTKFAAAAIVGATWNLLHTGFGLGRDNVGFQAWYGAMARYIPDDFGANTASTLAIDNGTAADPTGATAVQVQPDVGGTVYFQHWWTSQLRSNIGFGFNHQRLAGFLPADAQNAVTTKTVHVNLILQPTKTVDVGIEAMWGQKTYQASTGISPQTAKRIEVGGIWHF